MVKVVIYNNGKKVREEEGEALIFSLIRGEGLKVEALIGCVGKGDPYTTAVALGEMAVRINKELSDGNPKVELGSMGITQKVMKNRMDEILKSGAVPVVKKSMFTELKQ